MQWVDNFYGADWVGMFGNLFGLWCLGRQQKRGFIIGCVGCLGWLIFGILTRSAPSIVSNIVYIVMNIRCWRKWNDKPPQNPQ